MGGEFHGSDLTVQEELVSGAHGSTCTGPVCGNLTRGKIELEGAGGGRRGHFGLGGNGFTVDGSGEHKMHWAGGGAVVEPGNGWAIAAAGAGGGTHVRG